jgi:hypothetical protein
MLTTHSMRTALLSLTGVFVVLAPSKLIGDVVLLNGINAGDATVTINETNDTLSVGACQEGVCSGGTLVGNNTENGVALVWSIFSVPVPFDASTGALEPAEPAGSFNVSDNSNDAFGGSITLDSFLQGGTGATIIGTATATASETGPDPTALAAFDELLEFAGFKIETSHGLPTPFGTVPLEFNISNCISGGLPSACFPDPLPETITGTISSVTLGSAPGSAVPEPGYLMFLSCGIAGVALARHRSRS